METNRLAAECDLAKGTVTGLVTTLERQQLVERERLGSPTGPSMRLTPAGLDTIEDVFPRFNAFEADMAAGLDQAQKEQLAHLLRQVITNARADRSPFEFSKQFGVVLTERRDLRRCALGAIDVER